MIQITPQLDNIIRSVQDLIAKNPSGVFEADYLSEQLRVSQELVLDALIHLQKRGLLRPLFIWDCDNGYGGSIEREAVKEFPEALECERCGEIHYFDERNINVVFVLADTQN